MAKRESQGMQIALILLVMFALLFAITTALFWNQAKKANAELVQLRASQETARQEVSKFSLENQQFKKWLGFSEDAPMETVTQQVENDLKVFGQNYPEEQRNYRELPAFLVKTIQDQHNRLAAAAALERQLETERDNAREQERRGVKTAEDNHQKAASDLTSENEKFAQELTRIREQSSQLESKSKLQQDEQNKKIASLTKEISDLKAQLAETDRQNRKRGRELQEFRTESFEHPNGKVAWVNQSLRTVFLDLGSADGLRPQVTFSVYDVDENNVTRAEKKGSIEVTRILGEHMAEARILDDRVSNPIIAGDVIYSPIFQPGAPIRFALAGFMDVDGDGVSDRELVRNLIAINGGVIDAEVKDDGTTTGEVTIDTRFLVIGSEPTERTISAVREAQTAMLTEAEKASVTVIGLDEFLSQMGYAGSALTIGFAENAKSIDFRPDRRGDFRFRAPPTPSAGSSR